MVMQASVYAVIQKPVRRQNLNLKIEGPGLTFLDFLLSRCPLYQSDGGKKKGRLISHFSCVIGKHNLGGWIAHISTLKSRSSVWRTFNKLFLKSVLKFQWIPQPSSAPFAGSVA